MQLADRYLSVLAGAALLLLLTLLSTSPFSARFFERVNLVIYDMLLPVQAPPMSDELLVVAIDNRSLEELGRWPWDRGVHAELIERLAEMEARVIGVDVIFSEYQLDSGDADDRLAKAVSGAPVVLPVAPSRQVGTGLITELLPLPELAAAARGLGHVDVELDSDGLCRSTFLFGGIGNARWPSLALAMLREGESPVAAQYRAADEGGDAGGWIRTTRRLIPFTSPANGPRLVSYSDVLDGRIKKNEIEGRYVLIGATATGLGDAISTPGASSHERMPGVVLNAQIINGLLQEAMIRPLGSTVSMALTAFLVAVTALAVMLTPSRTSLALAVAGMLVVLATSASILAFGGRWFAPAGAIVALIVAWPLWTVWQYQRSRQLSDRLLRQLEHQTRFHIATGLPNSGMLLDRLRDLNEAPEQHGVCALMVMHVHWPGSASVVLDRPFSDPVLQAIRDRVRDIIRPGDFIAHLNGDDFAVLATGLDNEEEARTESIRFLGRMQEPFTYADEHLLLAPEIGVSLWPTDGSDPKELLSNAYTAMFKSRIDDTDNLCVYSASVSSELQARSQLEQALVYALERHEFSVHYQPQISAKTRRIVGVEALLRWENPLLGWVSPSAFVPVAEHVGLIKSIGAWVIEDACKQLQRWNEAGFRDLRLAINVSPLQFLIPGLEDEIADIIKRVNVDPGRIELEITESSLMQDIGNAIRIMRKIKEYGLELAIDDFGTGYSSLSNLRHFPLDRLKIDQAFTQEIGESPHAEKITLTIIAMARHLGMKIIAEGVETEAQAKFLLDHGCDELQGFLYGRPMPPEDLAKRLQQERSLRLSYT